MNGNNFVFAKEIKGGTGNLLGLDNHQSSDDKLVEHATTILSYQKMHE